jgi:Kef-type K+ transport system membrane component KefB
MGPGMMPGPIGVQPIRFAVQADSGSIQLLSDIGLGFLFLLAGYELDPGLFRDQSGRMAMIGWAVSADPA